MSIVAGQPLKLFIMIWPLLNPGGWELVFSCSSWPEEFYALTSSAKLRLHSPMTAKGSDSTSGSTSCFLYVSALLFYVSVHDYLANDPWSCFRLISFPPSINPVVSLQSLEGHLQIPNPVKMIQTMLFWFGRSSHASTRTELRTGDSVCHNVSRADL